MLNAIGYVRRSTDRQEESLDQQRQKLEAYAKLKGWRLVHVYQDDAISGSDLDRPGLQALLQRSEQDRQVGAVIAWDRNRLARPKEAIDGLLLERRMLEAGKRVCYVAGDKEADRSFAGGLLGYVEHYQNGDHLRKLSRDTARGVLSRVRRGRWPGGPIPFGYDRLFVDHDGTPRKVVRLLDDGSLSVLDATSGQEIERVAKGHTYKKQDHEEVTLIPSEPARVQAARAIFTRYAAGVPTRKIRDELNASGFRTSYGRAFCIPSINAILENATFAGRCVYNKRTESKWHRLISGESVERQDEGWERRPESDWVVTEDAWEAIVDDETFARCQRRRKESRENHRHATGSSVRYDYLLTGLFVCGVCGGKMTGHTTVSGKGVRTRYYECGRHHRGDKAACPKRYAVPADPVERHILGLIESDLSQLRDDEQLHAYIVEEVRRLTGGRSDARERLQRRMAELDQEAAKVRDHLRAMDSQTAQAVGIYDEAKRVAGEREQVERELAQCQEPAVAVPGERELRARAVAALDQFGKVWQAGSLEEKRALIAQYVHKVEADPDLKSVRISLYPLLFTRKIGVAR